MRTTTNYNLKVPETADTILGSIGDYADDLDSLDSLLATIQSGTITHVANNGIVDINPSATASGIYIADGTMKLTNYDENDTEGYLNCSAGTILIVGSRFETSFPRKKNAQIFCYIYGK